MSARQLPAASPVYTRGQEGKGRAGAVEEVDAPADDIRDQSGVLLSGGLY